jgi:membrane protein
MNRREFLKTAKAAFRKWQANNATIRAAALAFFIILPLPSVLLLTLIVYSQFYGPTQGVEQLISQIQAFAGPTVANLFCQLLEGVTNTFTSIFNSVLSVVFAAAGVMGVFVVLQDTFNLVWEVHLPKGRSLKTKVRERLSPFVLVFGSVILLVGLLEYTNLLLGSVSDSIGQVAGTFAASVFFFLIQTLFSFAFAAVLFGVIFKEIPDVKIEWGDVWVGAVITALVFTILNNVFGFYLRTFPVTSVTGAAGSIIILLLWIFVIAEALMYGAQFSKCYTENLGSHSNKGEHHHNPTELQRIAQELEKVKSKINPKEKTPHSTAEKEETARLEGESVESVPIVIEPEQGQKAEAPKERKVAVPEAVQKLSEPSASVMFEQTESKDASEKEYTFKVNWKQKKKGSRRGEDAESSSETHS